MSKISKRLVAGVILAGTLSVLDSTIVVPILRQIAGDLGGGNSAAWLVAGYLIASTVTIPIWSHAMDAHGERSALWCSLALFSAGTALAICSPSMEILIGARVLQGIGAGGIVPLSQAVLSLRVTPEQRARLQIFYNISYGTAAGLGPLLGAFVATSSWRWAFIIILPFCAITGLLLAGQLHSVPTSNSVRSIDVKGSVLMAVGLTLVLLGVTRLSDGPLVSAIAIPLGVITLAFLLRHLLRTPLGLIPLKIIQNKTSVMAAAVAFSLGFILYAFLTYLPILSHAICPSLNSGVVVIPLTLLWMTLGAISGVLALKVGARFLIFCSLPTAVVAALLIVVSSNLVILFVSSILAGAAIGIALIPVLLLSQQAAGSEDMAAATGFFLVARNFGGSLVVPVLAVASGALTETKAFNISHLQASFWIVILVAAAAMIPAILLSRQQKTGK